MFSDEWLFGPEQGFSSKYYVSQNTHRVFVALQKILGNIAVLMVPDYEDVRKMLSSLVQRLCLHHSYSTTHTLSLSLSPSLCLSVCLLSLTLSVSPIILFLSHTPTHSIFLPLHLSVSASDDITPFSLTTPFVVFYTVAPSTLTLSVCKKSLSLSLSLSL